MLKESLNSTNAEQFIEELFITQQKTSEDSTKRLRLNLKLLKNISESKDNYKTAIDIILLLEKILYTGKKRLSLREILLQSSSAFRNHQKIFSFSGSGSGSSSSFYNPQKEKSKLSSQISENQNSKLPQSIKPKQQQNACNDQQQIFAIDELNNEESKALIYFFTKIKTNLLKTVYQQKINSMIQQLSSIQKTDKNNTVEDDTYKKLLTQNGLGLEGNKNNKIQQFLTKGYQSLDGKFASFQALYTFISKQVLPLIERKILSISIQDHQQRQSFISKAINFLSNFYLHQYILEIKINKATLIENRIYVEKIFKENFKRQENLIMKNFTNIINEALLCPSNMSIQVPLFRLLKRMYYLWGMMPGGSSQFLQFKNSQDSLGSFIKYPLVVNLKNISLYSKSIDNQNQIKQAAMFCYKIINQKYDLYLSNQIQTLSQFRYIKQSKYFSSKAYAFSEEISKIYDTFDLRMGFWKYYKKIQRGEVWEYNLVIEKPNSLIIWQFYLQGYDIKFGIYKVDSFKKNTIEEYLDQVDCKQILKLEKCTAIQTQPIKGFLFLKNGLYKLVFDNSYSNFRGKELSYMILHLQSEN